MNENSETPPEWMALFPDIPEAFPVASLPSSLTPFIEAFAAKYSLGTAPVAAALLTTLAAALGPSHLIDSWTPTPVPATLNFVLIGAANPLLQKALETVVFPLTRKAEEQRRLAHSVDRTVLAAEYQQRSSQVRSMAQNGSSVALNDLRVVAGKFRGAMWPELLLERITPRRLQDALQRCVDLSLLLGPGQIDAADHWQRLQPHDRRELAAVLRQSWHRQASDVAGIPLPIHVPLLWRMSRETAPGLLRCPELFGNPGVPMFLLELEAPQPATPALAEPMPWLESWDRIMTTMLEKRTFEVLEAVQPYPFSSEAAEVLVGYVNRAASRSLQLPATWRPVVEFWPEAARRLSLIFALVDDQFAGTVSRDVVEAAIGVTEWFGWASLRALAALEAIPPARPSRVRPAPASPRERMLQRVQERGPISWRDLRRSFSNSRESLLLPVRDALIIEGCIGWIEGDAGPQLAVVRGDGGDDAKDTAIPPPAEHDQWAAAGLRDDIGAGIGDVFGMPDVSIFQGEP